MRLVLRIVGTWLLGLAFVLLVIDGTKSLAANSVVLTSFADAWDNVHAPSIEAVRAFFDSRFFADLLGGAFEIVLTYPAFAVLALPAIVMIVAGRTRRRDRYVQADQL
ncbi:hypothetical protein VW29_00720 [Devosia limi DSM 17137]|uniref:Uncharacterized protein n=1 Tax=Devosia limi DSM 17137 TaxID=1121477 RepID=A0A0F5LWQ8_9HYPH|nr:hypothetical protein [Devosia limi]KKB86810.1 hypothetical protein VW29_00720 [Devosia limi DSM 17137]SHF93794.1 hypothetical protein SAMN02745223_03933 [Devosia limi DSM 17137]